MLVYINAMTIASDVSDIISLIFKSRHSPLLTNFFPITKTFGSNYFLSIYLSRNSYRFDAYLTYQIVKTTKKKLF